MSLLYYQQIEKTIWLDHMLSKCFYIRTVDVPNVIEFSLKNL